MSDDAAALVAPVGFDALLGLEIVEVAPERCRGRLRIRPEHLQPAGIVHGGVHAAIVETVGSVAAWSRLEDPDTTTVVGAHNATDFFRPVHEGTLDAEAVPVHVGRTQQVWSVTIRHREGDRMVAQGRLRLAVVPRRDRSSDEARQETGT